MAVNYAVSASLVPLRLTPLPLAFLIRAVEELLSRKVTGAQILRLHEQRGKKRGVGVTFCHQNGSFSTDFVFWVKISVNVVAYMAVFLYLCRFKRKCTLQREKIETKIR